MSSASSDDTNIKEQQPIVVTIREKKSISDNQSHSSMSVHGGSITNVSPNRERIPRKKGGKKLSEISITGNKQYVKHV